MKTKTDYLSAPCVRRFIEWFRKHLDSETFAHSYMLRRSGRNWACENLFDAYTKYSWAHGGVPRLGVAAGESFVSNAHALAALRGELVAALCQDDDFAALAVCRDVMRWGGVSNGNVAWLTANRKGLARMLTSVRDALNSGDIEHPVLMQESLRFTSGMTKIYSLICDGLVIYDSRVAAAIGRAVAHFCQTESVETVPDGLAFPWMPARPNKTNPKVRNPGLASLVFPKLRGGTPHAHANLRASWILEALLGDEGAEYSRFVQIADRASRLRAIEAALFMFGYDLGGGSDQNGESGRKAVRGQKQKTSDCSWTECFTLKHGNRFEYRLADAGFAVRRGPKFGREAIDSILGWLDERFGEGPFPLANDRKLVPIGKNLDGFGTAYHAVTRRSAQEASKLVAILVDMSVIEEVQPIKYRAGMHFRLVREWGFYNSNTNHQGATKP